MKSTLYTLGHSDHSIDQFIGLLKTHGVTALADVRSFPSSRRFPQFDKAVLQASLKEADIRYVYLGRELGARPSDPAMFKSGRVDFDTLRASPLFVQGLRRLQEGMRDWRVCMMCAERDPAECHRAMLVGQALHEAGTPLNHILFDGALETQDMLLRRIARANKNDCSLFGDDDMLVLAAQRQAERIAYRSEELDA